MSYSPPRTIDDASLIKDGPDRTKIATHDDEAQTTLIEILQVLHRICDALTTDNTTP